MRGTLVRLIAGLGWLFLTPSLCAQRPNVIRVPTEPNYAGVAILVRDALGTPLPALAVVRLYSQTKSFNQTATTKENSEAFFDQVPMGVYVVEVSATGYRTTVEEVEILAPSSRLAFFISLTPEGSPRVILAPAGPPVLTPKVRKALDEALEALRDGQLEKARKRLEAARKLAPNHPDVPYLFGVLALHRGQLSEAQSQLEKAVAILPAHGAALAALGEVYLRRGDPVQAVRNLELALTYAPDTWQARGLLAAIYLGDDELEKAQLHAERALELTRGKVPGFRLLLAQVLVRLMKPKAAEQQLRLLVQEHPDSPEAADARRMLAQLNPRGGAPLPEAQPESTSGGVAPLAGDALLPLLRTGKDWAPPEVGEVSADVAADVSCSLPDVLAGAARQVQTLVNSLERITATERILYEELNDSGSTTYWEDRKMNYVVSFLQPRPEMLSVEEFRSPLKSTESNPRIASTGAVALAVLFHPWYAGDFDMTCAGLGQWHGRPVWIVDFRQKADRPVRVRTYRTASGVFGVRLKGRAWIDANSHHIVRLETDLLEPIPQVRLTRDHLVIEYGPVRFSTADSWLWLPNRAELYSQFRDRWYRVRHVLSDYMLFTIETRDKIAPPAQP